jgi:hypothetical protein
MSTNLSVTAQGISPLFLITAEDFILNTLTSMTPVSIDGVLPPWMGVDGGVSYANSLINTWFPWIDEKLLEPKYDGVGVYLGMPTNQPTYIKDYHMLTLFRATDVILAPYYQGLFQVTADGPTPIAPPIDGDSQ